MSYYEVLLSGTVSIWFLYAKYLIIIELRNKISLDCTDTILNTLSNSIEQSC
jgi:hypothetical protein